MWVPPKVVDDQLEQRREYEAALPLALEVKDRLDYWDGLLRDIDPNLTLVKARTNTNLPGFKPGYYHVVRHNPAAPPNVMVVEGPAGEFREPDSAMLDQLRTDDMWSDRAMSARQKRELETAKSKANAQQRDREDRVDEFMLRVKSRENPSIRGWTARKG